MLKNLTAFRVIISDFEINFYFDANCPLEVAKAALFECSKWVGQIEDQVRAQKEAQKEALEDTTKTCQENETQNNEAVDEQPIP